MFTALKGLRLKAQGGPCFLRPTLGGEQKTSTPTGVAQLCLNHFLPYIFTQCFQQKNVAGFSGNLHF
jgi:hypothetical protein